MSGRLATLGAVFKEVGRSLPGVVKAFDERTAAENRDSIMKWAEEQSYLDETYRKLKASGLLSEDPTEHPMQAVAMGANPAAGGSYEDWLAARDPDSVKRIQQTANDMGIQVHKKGGKLGSVGVDGKFGNETSEAAQAIRGALSNDESDPWFQQVVAAAGGGAEGLATARELRKEHQNTVSRAGSGAGIADQASAIRSLVGRGSGKVSTSDYSRTTSDPVSEALTPGAIQFGSRLFGRREDDVSPLKAEEARLNAKLSLMSRYRGGLSDDDFKGALEQLKTLGDQRREREAVNTSVRGEQTQLTTGVMNNMSAMDRQQQELSARADEGAKNRDADLERTKIMAAAGRYKADKSADAKGDDTEWKAAKALVDNSRAKLLGAQKLTEDIVKLKMRPEQAQKAAQAYGLGVIPGGIFGKDRVDMTAMSRWVSSLGEDLAKNERILSTYTRSDPGAPSPAPGGAAPSLKPFGIDPEKLAKYRADKAAKTK